MWAFVATIAITVAIWPTLVPAAVPPTEVNTCGQVFSGNGFLSGDLDCSAFDTPGFADVQIQGGTLDLQGFTLTSAGLGVTCTKSCKVISNPPGGTITSDGLGTVLAVSAGPPVGSVNLRISDVFLNDGRVSTTSGNIKLIDSTVTGITSGIVAAIRTASSTARLLRSVVTGNAGTGIDSAKTKVIDSEVSNNGEIGVFGSTGVTIKRSTVSGNGFDGVRTNSKSVRVTDSSITGNGIAGIDLPFSSKAKVVRSDISGNAAQGILGDSPRRIIVRVSTITNNGAEGIRQEALSLTNTIKLSDSTITGNALDGIAQIDMFASTTCQLTLKGTTTVTGNGTDASCGVSRTCADLTSCDLPKVDPTSMCDTSYDVNSGFPGTSWSVCALD